MDQEIAKTIVKDACLQPKPTQSDIPPTFQDTFGFDDGIKQTTLRSLKLQPPIHALLFEGPDEV